MERGHDAGLSLRRVLIGLWALWLGSVTASQVTVWASEERVWAQAVRVSPRLMRPRINYAVALSRRGALDEALTQWSAAAVLQRADQALPQPADLRRTIALQRAAIALARDPRHLAARQWVKEVGCTWRSGVSWVCPP